ncbi:kinase-like domain-containing protein [Rhizophagus clarus]|uniref:Kinase-like domain-containing protein n=1 Tax=Rhizophagus clarus TaxID=94130 RepID=A0A8H3QPZ1_9GLOM|nr:kinase-like domain-containing protein [Rhizophagus clarus]
MESGFSKVYHIIEASKVCFSFGLSIISTNTINVLCLSFVTKTQLGKTVLKEGKKIAFPFTITKSTKKYASGKFSEAPDKDASEKEVQDNLDLI